MANGRAHYLVFGVVTQVMMDLRVKSWDFMVAIYSGWINQREMDTHVVVSKTN